jgi:hypothetical protein
LICIWGETAGCEIVVLTERRGTMLRGEEQKAA